jgi:hypothetical protein
LALGVFQGGLSLPVAPSSGGGKLLLLRAAAASDDGLLKSWD